MAWTNLIIKLRHLAKYNDVQIPVVFFTNDIERLSKINLIWCGNTGGHTVDILTGLLIALIDNFDIPNITWMDLYIRDWKATLRFEIRGVN